MKYLVTDDSRMARKMTIKSLQDLIFEEDEIIQATNGEEAVSMYKEHNPDICFMDLTMPVMDGFDATLNITNYDNNSKIIIVSADIQEGSILKAKKNGAKGFIKKPINPANLKSMLEKLGLI
jgi:CheY-like chemotaxis protein